MDSCIQNCCVTLHSQFKVSIFPFRSHKNVCKWYTHGRTWSNKPRFMHLCACEAYRFCHTRSSSTWNEATQYIFAISSSDCPPAQRQQLSNCDASRELGTEMIFLRYHCQTFSRTVYSFKWPIYVNAVGGKINKNKCAFHIPLAAQQHITLPIRYPYLGLGEMWENTQTLTHCAASVKVAADRLRKRQLRTNKSTITVNSTRIVKCYGETNGVHVTMMATAMGVI